MVNYVSPGIYTIEKDISDYTPSVNTSIVGIVGFSDKGKPNTATLITSQSNLATSFGNPNENIAGQGLEGALEILEQTNVLYFVRALPAGAVDASAVMQMGTCPSIIVSGGADAEKGWGITSGLLLRIQVYDNEGTAQFNEPREFSIPAGTAASGQAQALRTLIGGGLDADKVGVFDGGAGYTGLGLSGAIVGAFAGSGASIGVSACSGTTTFDADKGVSALANTIPWFTSGSDFGASGAPNDPSPIEVSLASAVRSYGATFAVSSNDGVTASGGAAYLIESLYEGNGYNGGIKPDGGASGNSVTIQELGNFGFNVLINQDGVTQESFKSGFVNSGTFIEDVINTGETDLKSDIIKGNLTYGNFTDATVSKLDTFAGTTASLLGYGNSTGDGYQMTTQYLEATDRHHAGVGSPVKLTIGLTEEDGGTYLLGAGGGGRWNKIVQKTAQNLIGGLSEGAGTTEAQRATALIGTSNTDPKTGMQTLDDDNLNVGIALIPGIQTQSVQNNLITLAENTQNFLALVSPPYGVGTAQNAIDWTNGKSSSTAGSRTNAINSSYAAVHWPWLKIFSVFDGKDRWYDPSIFAARQMCFTDSVADSWIAPAGFRRGRLTKPVDTEVKLNQGDRDSLYSGGNVINPIVSFPLQGITIWGQRTTQRSPTALDRINVRRLMIYIRKIVLIAARRFVFEPNDEFTWEQIEDLVNPFLDDIRRRRGITQFRVVCDETTNTPVRVDRNEIWCKVLVKPTKAAEIIIFELNLTNQAAQLGSL